MEKDNLFKRLLRKPAVLFVTLWAKLNYRQGVEAAENRRKKAIDSGAPGNCMIFLACDTFHPDKLVTYDKRQFKAEKREYGTAAQLLTMNTLKSGSYYYTADKWGRGGIDPKEKIIRRKAFIKDRLRLAGLI